MAEELKKALEDASVETINSLTGWAKDVGNFAKGEIPGLAKEIIWSGYVYHATLVVAYLILALVVSVVLYKISKYLTRQAEEQESTYAESNYKEGAKCTLAGTVVSSIVGSVGVLINTYWLLFIYACPRLYTLQVIADLFKNKG